MTSPFKFLVADAPIHQPWIDAQQAAKRPWNPFTPAGPVRIIHPDGETELVPAYTQDELKRIQEAPRRRSPRRPS